MFFIPTAWAHEAYVLPHQEFEQGLHSPVSWHAWDALQNSHNMVVFIGITIGILVALVISTLIGRSKLGLAIAHTFERLAPWGPVMVRITLAISLFFSAYNQTILGPELSLGALPFAGIIRIILFACSGLVFFGLFSELAGAVGLIIYGLVAATYGWYALTYLNYAGELLALLVFGAGWFSIDRFMRRRNTSPTWHKYDVVVVRVGYGLALLYAAVNVKLLHPIVPLEVVTTYNLTQFHWLFPSDPLLVVLGAALAEIAIGIFIAIGFNTRLTLLISLFYITLSLLFFREAVWPHLLMYGISAYLLVTPPVASVDTIAQRRS